MKTRFVSFIVATLPGLATQQIDPGLSRVIQNVLYRSKPDGLTSYKANNPAQKLEIEFTPAGVQLHTAKGTTRFHLAGYDSAAPIATGNRIEYQRGNVVEWYKNEPGGLEQGFTIQERPEKSGPLVLALVIDADPPLTSEGHGIRVGDLSYAGVHSWDARGRAMPSLLEVREHEIGIVVDDRDSEYPIVVDPTWAQAQKLTEIAGAANDGFGVSLSVDGDTAVIGASGKTIGPNTYQGAAFVFVRGGSPPTWTLQQELTAPDGVSTDFFGASVSLSGDTILVGEQAENGSGGSVYVFVRGGSPRVWSLQQKLSASDGIPGFGYSVSLSGDTAVIGTATGQFNPVIQGQPGAAHVFVRGATTPPWTLQQKLTAPDGRPYDGFGQSLAISRDTVVVGARTVSQNAQPTSYNNAVYIFVRGATMPPWTLQQKLTGVNGSDFGSSVALSGDTALIGAYADEQAGGTSVPSTAYIFVRGATTPPWTQQQQLLPSDSAPGDHFGAPVAISGDTAVIGSGRVVNSNGGHGAVYVFTRSSNVWTQQQELTASDEMNDAFGFSVGISGSDIFIGAPGKQVGSNIGQGAAYAFTSMGPQVVSLSPITGSGLGPQTFTALYSDANGAGDLQVVYLEFGPAGGAAHSCFVAYLPASNALYLFNDNNTGILGPITPGTGATFSNSQCTLSGAGGAVTSLGNNLTVPFSINFAPGFSGAKNVFGLAQSYSGAMTPWQQIGTWTVPTGGPPGAVSVTPNSGSGLTQTFTATYTDPSGLGDLQVAYLDVGIAGGSQHSCFIAYIPSSNGLYLFNDANSGVSAAITPGSSATASNGQCTLSGSGGVVTSSGNNLMVPMAITFAPTFNGQKNLLGYAQSYSGANSDWQTLGTWTPAAGGTLMDVSVTPVNSSGFGPQTFAASYTDTAGGSDIQVAYLDFGKSLFASNSCIVVYVLSNNTLYLFTNDNSSAWGPITAGTGSTLSNSQCTLSGSGGLASAAGNGATVPFNITFAGAFAATQQVFGMAQSYGGTQSAWANLGTWTP